MSNMIDKNIAQYFTNLQEKSGILFCGGSDVESKISDNRHDLFDKIEDASWWYQYRARVIEQLAHNFLNKRERLFDIGGGNGWTTHQLQETGYDVVLLEPSLAACINAKKRGLRTIICGTLNDDSVKDASLNQVTILDVLEHIEHDDKFLRAVWKKLSNTDKGGGRILLTVPAFQMLWSSEDDCVRHYRRYRVKTLKELAEATGFKVLYINYFFGFLFFPILLVRVGFEKIGLLKRSEERTEEEQVRIITAQFQKKKGIVESLLNLFETWEIKRLANNKRVRLGSSIICVLEKVPKDG